MHRFVRLTPILLTALLSLPMLGLSGCGNDRGLATVEGTVTRSGQPQAGLWVRYTPAGGGRPGNGRTDDQGRYEIRYTSKAKGAHIGMNKVEIGSGGEIDSRGNEIRVPKQLFAKEVEVVDGANVIDFDISEAQ